MENPGLLVMIMKYPRANPPGHINVRIEPSSKVTPGVYFDINNHYDLHEGEEKVAGSVQMITILKENWEQALQFTLKIAEHLLGKDY